MTARAFQLMLVEQCRPAGADNSFTAGGMEWGNVGSVWGMSRVQGGWNGGEMGRWVDWAQETCTGFDMLRIWHKNQKCMLQLK